MAESFYDTVANSFVLNSTKEVPMNTSLRTVGILLMVAGIIITAICAYLGIVAAFNPNGVGLTTPLDAGERGLQREYVITYTLSAVAGGLIVANGFLLASRRKP